MKKLTLLVAVSFQLLTISQKTEAQYSWTQKASLTAYNGREGCTAFSIGQYGFIGTGETSSGFENDMWKWNQTTNTWTAIANYAGAGKYGVTSFAINGKGYSCLGWTGSTEATDLWEYDTASNSWTQKANFPGAGRDGAFAFVIGTKAYVGSGEPNGQPYDQDMWVYDAVANTWTQMASLPGIPVSGMIAFSLNGYGYAGGGSDGLGTSYNEMYQYNPNTNTWSSVASLPVSGIEDGAVSFVLDTLAYVGTGIDASNFELYSYFWSYSATANRWTTIATLPGYPRWSGVGFSIGNKGYVGMGDDSVGDLLSDYWQYGPYTTISPLSVTSSVSGNVNCNGGNNGSATATATGGTAPYTYLWSPGGQTTATANGLAAGTYTVSVTDNTGSSVSATVVITQPSAISVVMGSTPDNGRCNGSAWVTVGGGVSPYTYLWLGGQATDSISGQCRGNYCCTITDANGCSQTVCIYIGGCSNPYVEPICLVTVDMATNKAEIIWGRTNSPDSGSYNIYREGSLGYTLLHSQPVNSLSEYLDATSNPSDSPVSYELSTVNSCCESALSPAQSTMYLTASSGTNGLTLNWTAFTGFTTSEYLVFRGESMNSLEQIASVSNTTLSYLDNLPPSGSFYVVEAVNTTSMCIPSTRGPVTQFASPFSGSFSNGINSSVLGISQVGNSTANLNIYPNPSNGTFTLNYSATENGNVQISIINELGQMVYSENKKSTIGTNIEQVNLSNLASGIYTLRMESNSGSIVKKLVILEQNNN